MILICGIPTEAPLRLVIDAAQKAGAPHVVFNQRHWGSAQLSLAMQSGSPVGELRIDEYIYPLEGFSGIYARLMDHSLLPGGPAPEAQNGVERLYRLLNDWLEITPARVMNRASAMGSNQSKPYQAQLIAKASFRIPDTLVTNDPERARAFILQHGRVVYKSISAVRSIVGDIRSDGPPRLLAGPLEKIRALPVQFQAYIPGENLRVHVAGEQVFGALIHTEAVDYRYAAREGRELEMEAVTLDPLLAERCLGLSKALNLPLCGIDLKRTPDGEIYCFEVNPMPAFSYYEEMTGQPIAEAVVAWLGDKL